MRVNNPRMSNQTISTVKNFPGEESKILKDITLNTNKTIQSEKPKILFILNLDIGGGKSDKIEFRETDNPESLSLEFCKKHSLNIKVYDFIVKALNEKFREVTKKKFQPLSKNSGLDSAVFEEENENLFSFNPSKKKKLEIEEEKNLDFLPEENEKNPPSKETYIPQNKSYYLARKSIKTNSPTKKLNFEEKNNDYEEDGIYEYDGEKKQNFFVKNRSGNNSRKNSRSRNSRNSLMSSTNSFVKSSKEKSLGRYSRLKREIQGDNFQNDIENGKKRGNISISYSGFFGEKSNENKNYHYLYEDTSSKSQSRNGSLSYLNKRRRSSSITGTPIPRKKIKEANVKREIKPIPKPKKQLENPKVKKPKGNLNRTFSHGGLHAGVKRSHMLYISGKRMFDNKMKKSVNYFKKIEEEASKDEPSFHPVINKTSDFIATMRMEGSSKKKTVYERLIEKGEIYQTKKHNIQKKRVEEESRSCKFKPKVNKM